MTKMLLRLSFGLKATWLAKEISINKESRLRDRGNELYRGIIVDVLEVHKHYEQCFCGWTMQGPASRWVNSTG